MRGDEMRDSGALLGTALGEVAEVAQGMHRAIAGRLFGLLGSPAAPVRLMHDGMSTLAYTSARIGMRVVPAAAGYVADAASDPAAGSAHDSLVGHAGLSALNGWMGDRLTTHRPALALDMRIRTHTGPLRRLPENVVHDVGSAATGRIVLFLHGLVENSRFWSIGADKAFGDPDATYGSMLRDDDGWTPLYVSFNTGLHISSNGHELADQIDALVAAWPVAVEEIALVGHSAGGLVARSAAVSAAARQHDWIADLRHVVTLGAPHLGAGLERFANFGTHALSRLPETRPLARWLNRRSVGIKDLRYGSVVDEDWTGFDPDERLRDRTTPAEHVPGVGYYAVSATLTRSPLGRLDPLGDLLVTHDSATATGRRRQIPFHATLHVGGRSHFHLLADTEVYRHIRSWLAGDLLPVSG